MASLGSMTLEEIRQLSISDLKSRLARHNVNVATCIEKEDLVRALHGALARKSGRSGRGNGGNDGDDSSDRKRKANEVITLDDSEDDEDSRHAKKHSSFKREFGHPQEPICLDSDSEDEARPRAAAARRRQGGNSINSIIPFRLCETATSRTLSASERRFFASMREMMGLKSGRRYSWLIICNYLIDFSYLFQRASPELLQFQRVVVFYGTSGQACPAVMRQWERLLEGTGRTVAFVQLLPSDPPNSRANPLPVKIEYGVHHTKVRRCVAYVYSVQSRLITPGQDVFDGLRGRGEWYIEVPCVHSYVQHFALGRRTQIPGSICAGLSPEGGSRQEHRQSIQQRRGCVEDSAPVRRYGMCVSCNVDRCTAQ